MAPEAQRPYTPLDWYWLADDGRVYASGRKIITDQTDAGFVAAQVAGAVTRWPADDAGTQTDAALSDVIGRYGLTIPGYAMVPESVSSAQAKIQCLRTPGAETGKTLLDDITAAVQGAGGEAEIWFTEARTWERDNPYVANLSTGLKLKPADVDQLFIAAAQIAA